MAHGNGDMSCDMSSSLIEKLNVHKKGQYDSMTVLGHTK